MAELKHVLSYLSGKALRDPDFRKSLAENPEKALENLLKDLSVKISDDQKKKIVAALGDIYKDLERLAELFGDKAEFSG